MHRSRLQVVLIDSPQEDADAEVAFWSAALGSAPEPEPGSPFTSLAPLGSGGHLIAHQRLGSGAARIHLDIETDDPEAEVQRLESLGAVRIGEHDGCVHMRDPAQLVFCVVPVQSEDFEQNAREWD